MFEICRPISPVNHRVYKNAANVCTLNTPLCIANFKVEKISCVVFVTTCVNSQLTFDSNNINYNKSQHFFFISSFNI